MQYTSTKITTLNNEDIFSISITNDNNFSISFYTFGGYFHQINIPYKNDSNKFEDVLLGYGKFNDCVIGDDYFNFIIGRVCNRIGSSKFNLNNKDYNLYPNTPPDHLHGGKIGFNKKNWRVLEILENKNEISCCLEYFSPHLEENYPGNLKCKTIYALNNNNELTIDFYASTDLDTIVNLTNHNYWNFHGHNNFYHNITEHSVQIKSSKICEIDNNYISTGKLIEVKNTKFDLNNTFSISQDFLDSGGIDHNYVLKDSNIDNPIATIFSELSGMGVEYFTNQPGIQFYTGNMMKDKYEGKYSKSYGKNYGLCLEPQNFPDSINHDNFPSIILRKDEKYHSKIKIKLKNNF